MGREMAKTISLREANRTFARCIREVEAGKEYVITRNGEPVARPARAWARMEKGWPLAAGPLDRAALHER